MKLLDSLLIIDTKYELTVHGPVDPKNRVQRLGTLTF